MNRRAIVVYLLSSTILLGRVHAQQTGKVYHIAVISQNWQPSDMGETGHDPALARVWGAFFGELRRLVSLHNDYDSLILERRVSEWQG